MLSALGRTASYIFVREPPAPPPPDDPRPSQRDAVLQHELEVLIAALKAFVLSAVSFVMTSAICTPPGIQRTDV